MAYFDWAKDNLDEKECNGDYRKIWVKTYIKNDGTIVKGHCRDRQSHEIPHPPSGVKPFIGTARGRARYYTTEEGEPSDWRTSDGYWVVHNGKKHHVYVVED